MPLSSLTNFSPLSSSELMAAGAAARADVAPAPLPSPIIDAVCAPVLEQVAGVLVPVTDAGIVDLAAYRAVGWDGALRVSLIRREIAERLAAVSSSLPSGFGLAVYDAWRPLALQSLLYETLGEAAPLGYISAPSPDPTTPPPHLTGATADLTLTFDGVPLSLGTDFDHFGPRAHPDALESASIDVSDTDARDLRRLLFSAMSAADFVVHHLEWWHFETGTARWSAITGRPARFGPISPTV